MGKYSESQSPRPDATVSPDPPKHPNRDEPETIAHQGMTSTGKRSPEPTKDTKD
ncbi:MAG TPA: hypothetical protein VNS88_15890 [Nitrospiraceae bacterium]|nr:hypothetical protein [Nitrospiraceae bacterium]